MTKLPLLLAAALLCTIGVSLQAQAPPSTTRLLARIAELERQVADLHASCAATTPTLVTIAPASMATLAEASAAARAQGTHDWPVSAQQIPRYDPANALALGDTQIVSVDRSPAPLPLTSENEARWKGRMRALQTQLDNDQTILAAAVARERALDHQLHRNADDVLYIRDRIQRGVVESQWQDAVTDVSRSKVAVTNDTRAKANLELEAHRAGVPPGWLILE